MNTEIKSEAKPPYVAYKTFSNFIRSLRESGIPNRIDRSVPALSGQSGATQSFLLAALRFLALISQDGIPSAALKEIVAHPANEKTTLAKVIRESYGFIFDSKFNVEAATEAELGDKFKEKDLSGQTVRKAITFFVTVCESAGIKLSPHLRPKRGSGNGTITRRYKKRRPPPDEDEAGSAVVPQPTSSLQDKLIEKFPKFDPEWSPELQTRWFESFEKFMASVKKVQNGG